jgi:hypothetical protein
VKSGHGDRTVARRGEALFWDLAAGLLQEPGITRSTMMGYPCLRDNDAFFACVERTSGHLIVKLAPDRVHELVRSGRATAFAPNGRTFREWASFPRPNRREWIMMLGEAREFVSGQKAN